MAAWTGVAVGSGGEHWGPGESRWQSPLNGMMALLTVNVEGVQRGGKGTQRLGPGAWEGCCRGPSVRGLRARGAGLQGGKSGTWHSPAGSGSPRTGPQVEDTLCPP